MKTDTLFQLDAHVTRDFTENFWGGIDGSWYEGGKSTINGAAGKKLGNFGWGLTLGYKINDNAKPHGRLQDNHQRHRPGRTAHGQLHGHAGLGWHPLVEGAKRLQREK